MTFRVLLTGHGKMGQMLESLIAESIDLELAGTVDSDNVADLQAASPPFGKADVIVDFSGPGLFAPIAEFVKRTGTALVCGTTGFADPIAEVSPLGEFAPVVYSGNYSRGIQVLKQLVGKAGKSLRDWDVEVVEIHHNQKVDAPSGTARLLVEQLPDSAERLQRHGRLGTDAKRQYMEIGVHSLRGGTVAGEHTVYFFGLDEVVEIKHQAFSRRIFALGALEAARILVGKPKGFYSFDDLMQ